MELKRKILSLLSKDGLAYSGLNNLFSFISKTYNISVSEVKKQFDKLKNNGEIFEIRKGKFITIPSHGYIKGKFIGNAKGFGFVQTDTLGEKEDVFIPANLTGNAIDGDLVIVKILSSSEEGIDGKVVDIFKPIEKIVGVVVKVGKNYFLEPDNNHIPFKFKILSSSVKYLENDRAVAKVIRNTKTFSAQIVENLGLQTDIKACELGIIREYNLYETFPENVLEECKKIPDKVLEKQKKNRKKQWKMQMYLLCIYQYMK